MIEQRGDRIYYEKNACYNCIREAKTPENYLYPGVATPELVRISIHAADRDFKTCYQQAEKKRNYFVKRIIPPNNEESIQIYADIDQEPDGDVWLFCWQN